MGIESTKEYKQDRINVRNINAIILTGRCYKYKDSYYELLGINLLSKINDNWVSSVRYKKIIDDTNELEFIRLQDDFNSKFVHITEQLL
jgi:hypothetical protein